MNSAAPLPPADYETRDASAGAIIWSGVGLGAAIVAVLVLSGWLYLRAYHGQPPPDEFGRQTSFRYGAQAQTSIQADWARQDAAVNEHLETYGWVDRETGIVRIPIDRAMQLMVEESKAGEKVGKGAKP